MTTTIEASIRREKALLGAMMLDNNIIPTVRRALREEDFKDPRNRMIYEGILDCHYCRGSVTPMDVIRTIGDLYSRDVGVGITVKAETLPAYLTEAASDPMALLNWRKNVAAVAVRLAATRAHGR